LGCNADDGSQVITAKISFNRKVEFILGLGDFGGRERDRQSSWTEVGQFRLGTYIVDEEEEGLGVSQGRMGGRTNIIGSIPKGHALH
jgi:hypothetical protein